MKATARCALLQAEAQLEPATLDQFKGQITACLALVASVGMTDADRTEWVRAAAVTLAGIPADLLARGCGVARRFADHPSKIVPAIILEVEPAWNERKRARARVQELIVGLKRYPWEHARPAADGEFCTPAEAAEILAKVGLRAKAAAVVDPSAPKAVQGGAGQPGRTPTREDYIRLGVAPETLDAIEAERRDRAA